MSVLGQVTFSSRCLARASAWLALKGAFCALALCKMMEVWVLGSSSDSREKRSWCDQREQR